MEYTLTKFVHVTLAIVALGFNLSYGIWLARAAGEPAGTQLWVLRGIRFLDSRVANPAYALLLVSGLFMVFDAGYPLTTFWIAASLVLYLVALVLGIAVIAPAFRAQARALETEGPDGAAFGAAAARGRLFGMLVALDVIAIVFLMVTKPG